MKYLVTKYRSLDAFHKRAYLILVLMILGSLLLSIHYSIKYSGCDLRSRTVGARVLDTKASPYFYKWLPGDSETLLDPSDDPTRIVNAVTMAPGMLYVQSVFNSLHYSWIKIAWTICQIGFVLYVLIFFLLKHIRERKDPLLLFAITTIFFLCSPTWLINIERGQSYTLFLLFFCLLYQLLVMKKNTAWLLAGLLIALASYCRPNFIVTALPLVLFLNRQFLYGLGAGGAVMGLHAAFHWQLWKDYFQSMTIWNGIETLNRQPSTITQDQFPQVIEGMSNLRDVKNNFNVGVLRPLPWWASKISAGIPNLIFTLAYFFIAVAATLRFRMRSRKPGVDVLCLLAFLVYILSEYFMAAPRGTYNGIQWMFPVLVMLHSGRLTKVSILLMVTGLCLMNSYPFYFPYFYDIGELLLVFVLVRFISTELPSQVQPAAGSK